MNSVNTYGYYLGHAKDFASHIILSKAVQSNLEKISYVYGYVWMNANQFIFGKKHLAVPAIVQKHFIEGTHDNLDMVVGMATAPSKWLTSVADIMDPILKGFSEDKKAAAELVSKYAFPKEILEESFKDLRNFILNSQLYIPICYYNYSISYCDQTKDILFFSKGKLIFSSKILDTLKLEHRAVTERGFLPPFIIDKKTKELQCWLENGITQHDVEKDIRPYKILPEGQRPLKPILNFNFAIDSELETPEDAANFCYHSWFEVQLANGECYSFGLYGQGIIQCPDPVVFRKNLRIRSIPFEISKTQVGQVFRLVRQLRREIAGKYHFTKRNCSTLLKKISKVIGIEILEKEKIKVLDNTVLRIKMYAISSMLAHFSRNSEVTSKIYTLRELVNFVECFDQFPVSIKEFIFKFSLEKSFESITVKKLLEDYPSLKKTLLKKCSSFLDFLNKMKLEQISHYIKGIDKNILKEIKTLCDSILIGSEKELTYKIYNLFNKIFTNYYEYEVDSPGFVYKRLKSAAVKSCKYEVITLI